MITILLAGQARVGKTVAANYIAKMAKKEGFRPVILPFADAIKKQALELGINKDTDPVGYRAFCQSLGEDKRKENPDHWINLFEQRWKELYEQDIQLANNPDKLWCETVVIVDDCRFLNEVNFGRKINATSIFVSRGDRVLSESDAEWRKHESEEMANTWESGNKDYADIFEWVIRNNGTENDYLMKLKDRLPFWLGLDAAIHCGCDCVGCDQYKKDKIITDEEYIRRLLLEIEEDSNDGA